MPGGAFFEGEISNSKAKRRDPVFTRRRARNLMAGVQSEQPPSGAITKEDISVQVTLEKRKAYTSHSLPVIVRNHRPEYFSASTRVI